MSADVCGPDDLHIVLLTGLHEFRKLCQLFCRVWIAPLRRMIRVALRTIDVSVHLVLSAETDQVHAVLMCPLAVESFDEAAEFRFRRILDQHFLELAFALIEHLIERIQTIRRSGVLMAHDGDGMLFFIDIEHIAFALVSRDAAIIVDFCKVIIGSAFSIRDAEDHIGAFCVRLSRHAVRHAVFLQHAVDMLLRIIVDLILHDERDFLIRDQGAILLLHAGWHRVDAVVRRLI